jgi:hypothetical protein
VWIIHKDNNVIAYQYILCHNKYQEDKVNAALAQMVCGRNVIGWASVPQAGRAADLPSYMAPIAGTVTSTPAEVADQNLLALNAAMFDLYSTTGAIFQRNILARHPVILGLFSGAGGRFILYRPGQPPLEAPPVPQVYQLMKSTGHSTMALTQVVEPYLENRSDQSWRASLMAYRGRTLITAGPGPTSLDDLH